MVHRQYSGPSDSEISSDTFLLSELQGPLSYQPVQEERSLGFWGTGTYLFPPWTY